MKNDELFMRMQAENEFCDQVLWRLNPQKLRYDFPEANQA